MYWKLRVIRRKKIWLRPLLCLCILILYFNFMKNSLVTETVNEQRQMVRRQYLMISDSMNYENPDSFLPCEDKELATNIKQRGQYWVLHNYVKANRQFGCSDSITYTAIADLRFLDNLVPLVERWKGPFSVAIYAPGEDFYATLDTIAYLRQCTSELIKELVSFHIFFENTHLPRKTDKPLTAFYDDFYDCRTGAPFLHVEHEDLYKAKNNLTFPINVARNIARQSAQTHFVFASDIELYPTPNFIEKFLSMIKNDKTLIAQSNRNVFVLPLFEIEENLTIPTSKTDLQMMFKAEQAILFHQKLCAGCHQVPDGALWMETNETEGLHIFTSGKRHEEYAYWEPFFVSTQREPLFDERLSWEGQGNKMSQAYSLCLLDYNFLILDNAFLVHKPGIKKEKEQSLKYPDLVTQSNDLIKVIANELVYLYGNQSNCKIKKFKKKKKKT